MVIPQIKIYTINKNKRNKNMFSFASTPKKNKPMKISTSIIPTAPPTKIQQIIISIRTLFKK